MHSYTFHGLCSNCTFEKIFGFSLSYPKLRSFWVMVDCQIALDLIQQAIENFGSDIQRIRRRATDGCPQTVILRAGIVTMGGKACKAP